MKVDSYITGVALAEIVRNKRSEARNTGIYLLKKYTAATNAKIGELFGGLSYSAVAKVAQNVAREMVGDIELRERIGCLVAEISIFKG